VQRPKKDTAVPEPDHVLRYIGRKHVDKQLNQINGAGFLGKPSEDDGPSVNWMECFDAPVENQKLEIRSRKRMSYEKRGKLVRLNVAHTKSYVSKNAPIPVQISFVHDPLAAEGRYLEDPSHALMKGVPRLDTPEGELVKDLFLDCIVDQWDAIPD
jgi:hypothetical protein